MLPGLAIGAVPRDPVVFRQLAGQNPAQRVRVTVTARLGGKVATLYEILEEPVPGDRNLDPIEFLRRLDKLLAARLLEEDQASMTE
jgi:hypothetical protein